jgi:hypothetical protein
MRNFKQICYDHYLTSESDDLNFYVKVMRAVPSCNTKTTKQASCGEFQLHPTAISVLSGGIGIAFVFFVDHIILAKNIYLSMKNAEYTMFWNTNRVSNKMDKEIFGFRAL